MQRFEFLKKIKLPDLRRISRRQWIFWGVSFALAIGVYLFTRGFTTCWQLTKLPGIPPSSCANSSTNQGPAFQVNAQGTPIAGALPPAPILAPEALPPAWDGASRINILFIGLDYRDWQANEGPPRTDTMILFSIDPISKTAGMLSIPRDMWVNIPGFGYSRINTAYPSGEGSKLPGGGPGLAMKTVEQFIGVPVNYYAQIDFGTFTNFIDYIGGVDVYVDQTLTLDMVGPGYDQYGHLQPNDKVTLLAQDATGRFVEITYPSGPNGKGWILSKWAQVPGIDKLPVVATTADPAANGNLTATITMPTDIRGVPGDPNHVRVTCCGYRHLDGTTALAFARTRHTEGGDVDRAKRQQQVIFAVQKKVFDPVTFAKMIADAPALYQQFSSGIHTNLSLDDAIKLAVLVKGVPRSSINTGVIDTSMVTLANVTLAGQPASVMKPIMDKIRVLRDQIFTTSGPTSPIAQGDPVTLMRTEEARVRILDGTFLPNMAQRAGTFFQSQGLNVTEVGQATETYSSTVVVVYGPKLYTLRYLVSTFGITGNQIHFSPDPNATADIEIRLGTDIGSRIP